MVSLSFLTMHIVSFCPLLCLCLLFSRAGAHFVHGLVRCQFSAPDGHDVVYLLQIYSNKVLLCQYNSTLGKYVGYTEKVKDIVDGLNKNSHFMKQERKNVEKCKSTVPVIADVFLKPVEPIVKLRSSKAENGNHPEMLICSGYRFYPKQIIVTWLRNGKKVISDVTSTEELPNGDWFYQIHSYLEYTPTPGEKITCMVEHASLREPELYDWDPRLESSMNKIITGTSVMLLGLVFFVAGLIFYRRRITTGRQLVPTS